MRSFVARWRSTSASLRVVIACFVPIAIYGAYARFSAIPDVLCKSPDELAELMTGLRLHALPLWNIHDDIRQNFVKSMFYSNHGWGDGSFYYLSSSLLSLLDVPIAERHLYAAGGVANLALIFVGALTCTQLLENAGAGWMFAALTLASPFYVFASKTGWARLTWTPLLLLCLFLSLWNAMRGRRPVWIGVFVALCAFVPLTDGIVMTPLVVVLALFVAGGKPIARVRQVATDRVFLAGFAALLLVVGLEAAIGIAAHRRGTSLTLVGYILFKGQNASPIPSLAALAAWARCVDSFFPFRGPWLLVVLACVLAAREGLRGRMIGFVAAWWLLASFGLLRYMTQSTDIGPLNAYQLAVPTYLLFAWLLAVLLEGKQPFGELSMTVRAGLAAIVLVPVLLLMPMRANTGVFATALANVGDGTELSPLDNCRAVKAAGFYIRSHAAGRPYVFHVSSDVSLAYIAEFYYGLSRGASSSGAEPNHLFDFGLNQFHRPYAPSAFYGPYGVEHFDYYVDFSSEIEPLKATVLRELVDQGARNVCTIHHDGRVIARIWSFHDEAPIDVEYRNAAAAWERDFAHPRTFLLDRLAGTSYYFGDNWRAPDDNARSSR